jgi:hypothetical protein
MTRTFSASLVLMLSSLMLACGGSEVGEPCDEAGSTDECEDGAICTNEESGAVCRLQCKETHECPAQHACNGVSGSNLKSCQPDK